MQQDYEIDIRSDLNLPIDEAALVEALQHALREELVAQAVLSVTIVDNLTIHRLNQQHLQHDYPTDVISFSLDWLHPTLPEPPLTPTGRSQDAMIEGEIVIGGEYAAEMAKTVQWSLQNELTLYAVHGMLHICGYDDLSPQEKQLMRSREKHILKGLGVNPEYPDDEPPGTPDDNGRQAEPSSQTVEGEA